jgi:hypothetical protein
MSSTVNSIFHFSYFDPDYPTSGLTVTAVARIYCSTSADSFVGHGIPAARILVAGEMCCSLLVGLDARVGIPHGEELWWS